ncbi:MAG TPA: hypothetical protein VH394_12700 [Thermoanaerobaculia bacterium]|jgi:RimJ/RimL family protein N-acetyltransferase|nr:hypothetical protein [Thermoanaerobaculia bacterium]
MEIHIHIRGYGMWAVEEKETGSFVGRIGFYNPDGWTEAVSTYPRLGKVAGDATILSGAAKA